MTNVYTRKHKKPRSVTHIDYRPMDVSKRSKGRAQSPTRAENPHPAGLHQQPTSRKTYFIWKPNFPQIVSRYPEMLDHMGQVNFTCKYDKDLFDPSRGSKLPKIAYTENTMYRKSYIDPVRLPALVLNVDQSGRFGHFQNRKPITGIVPNLVVPEYIPVIDH